MIISTVHHFDSFWAKWSYADLWMQYMACLFIYLSFNHLLSNPHRIDLDISLLMIMHKSLCSHTACSWLDTDSHLLSFTDDGSLTSSNLFSFHFSTCSWLTPSHQAFFSLARKLLPPVFHFLNRYLCLSLSCGSLLEISHLNDRGYVSTQKHIWMKKIKIQVK